MAKKIKKSQEYLLIILGIIIILPTVFYFLLSDPDFQTFLVKRVSLHFSKKFESTISVGKIEYKFFNKLSFTDILIKDQNNDTMLYAQNVTAGIREMDLKHNKFRFGKVNIVRPYVALITDSTGLMNFAWYLNQLKNPADSVKKRPSDIFVNEIDLNDARFSFINHSGKAGKTKMDFNNLVFTDINGTIEDIKIQDDTASLNIYNMILKEAGGFDIKRMNSSLKLSKQNILLTSASITTNNSILNVPRLGIAADSSSSFKKFSKEVKLDIILEKSIISAADLQNFISTQFDPVESVWLSGKIFGTISELRGRNIELSYRDYSYLSCDFDFSGLPKIEDAFIYIGVNSLRTNAKDIAKIKIPGKGFIAVPEALYKLGTISFDGSFTGFTTDFVTYGKIRTKLGNMRTDISFRPEKPDKFRIKGLLAGSDINLGELSGKPDLLGKLSMRTNVDGYAYSLNKFAANLSGQIDSVELNHYKYRNIALNGLFTEKTWDGSVKIADENIKLDLLGLLSFSNKLPEFDFTLNVTDANLCKLNFDKSDTTSSLTMLLTSNFKGNSIDNLDGEIRLLNSTLRKYNNKLDLYDFSIKTYTENDIPVLSLRTDFIDADIKGKYNFAGIGALVKSTLAELMPSHYQATSRQRKRNLRNRHSEPDKNNFSFDIDFKNTDNINDFFRTGISLADKSYIKGEISGDSIINIVGKSKMFSIKNNVFNDLSVNMHLSESELAVGIKSSVLSILRQSELKDFSVSLNTKPDNLLFTVDWDNKDSDNNRGSFIAKGSVSKNSMEKRNTILTIDIDSTRVYSRNNLWRIHQSKITIDSNSVKIDRFHVSNNDNFYLVNGTVSENPADTLHLEFKGIDLSPLNYLGNQKNMSDPDKVRLNLKGRLDGKILLANMYKNLLLEGNIILNNVSLLGNEYGNISLFSDLDVEKKVFNLKADNDLNGAKMLDIAGTFNPSTKKLDLDVDTRRLPLDFLNPLLKSFASDIRGLGSGKVNFTSEQGRLVLKGAILAENTALKVNYLQTKYKMNDTVLFDRNGIKFNNITVTDEKGNMGTLNGAVYHKNFKDFRADIVVNTNNCLVLNTKPKDNILFYGTGYASGVTTIKSGQNSLSFDISAKTGKNTKFYIPINSGLSVSENSFITFIDPDSVKEETDPKIHVPASVPLKKTGINMNFDLEVTPDAEVQIIFDSKVGDVMKGHGSGNLNLDLDKKGDFKISGDYIIEDGDYLFTLGNILNKSFSVENGGRIIFNGDIDNAEIDIKAKYKLKASLYEILQDDAYKERIPVECQLNLTGKLFNPIVGFDIYLPSADEQTRTYLKNAISTEEELSRQFLYLLVMNSFIADPSFTPSSTSSTTTGTSAMAVTTTEMLSNQLSNWLSQISNDFDIGFVYRPESDQLNPQEVEVALSTQLLNDKVVINGNFDVKGTGTQTASNNTDQITGDFDAEVKITEKVRFKVFNRYNNPYTGKLVDYTQGIGIFFKQDFDKLSDLFRKKTKNEMKKKDTPVASEK
jgi:hypothetical protein